MKQATSHASRPRASALAVALAFAPAWAGAQVLPTAPSVIQGSASISRPATGQMTVQQNTQNALINWQSFSIGQGGRVVFNQPNAQSIALNRVTGSDPSSIFGSLSANGRVFLVNPNGVLFGAGASVNVSGLVASTLNVSDSDFAAGRYIFSRGNAAAASVTNAGTLQAATGGLIALVGSTVSNSGTINAPQGTVGLASGKTVTLDFQGDGLTQLRVSQADLQALAANSGTLSADGGKVLMLANATQATGFVVNQSGIVRARSLTQGPGGVLIAGGAGDVSVTGSIDTSGGAGLRGGDVTLSGRNVGLLGQGRINAGGDRGGANVALVASAVAGHGGIAVVAPDAQITASAGTQGHGGRIDLTGDGVRALGSFSARGGSLAGDGGLVKITASGGVEMAGVRVDASARHGHAGTFNIDPYDVYIYDDASSKSQFDSQGQFDAIAESFIDTGDINRVLGSGSNVTITTGTDSAGSGGTIYLGRKDDLRGIDSAANIVNDGNVEVELTLVADRGIVTSDTTFRSSIGSSFTDYPLGVSLNARSNVTLTNVEISASNVNINGASIEIGRGANVSANEMTVIAQSGNITLDGSIAAINLDMATPATFQITGTIDAKNRWHLYAGTWIGEERGGLVGDEPLPNIFGYTYSPTSAVGIPEDRNAFIYADRPPPNISIYDIFLQDVLTYVYELKVGTPEICVPQAPLDVAARRQAASDLLAIEWSRLRARPKVASCVNSGRTNGCGDF